MEKTRQLARVFFLAGASLTPDSPRHSPEKKLARILASLASYSPAKFKRTQNSHVITWEEQTVYQQDMSSPKRTRSPSGEHPDPHTVESKISVQEEITERKQELMCADDKARTLGKSSRSVNVKTVCWFKNIFGYFCCSKW
jgi:hypothetical protein